MTWSKTLPKKKKTLAEPFSRLSVHPRLAPGCQPAGFDRQRHVFDARRRRRRLLRRRGRFAGEENRFRGKRRRKDSGRLFEVNAEHRFGVDYGGGRRLIYYSPGTWQSFPHSLTHHSPVTHPSLIRQSPATQLSLICHSPVTHLSIAFHSPVKSF